MSNCFERSFPQIDIEQNAIKSYIMKLVLDAYNYTQSLKCLQIIKRILIYFEMALREATNS